MSHNGALGSRLMYGPVGNGGGAEPETLAIVDDGGTTLLLTAAELTAAELTAARVAAAELATTEDDAGAVAASLAKRRAQRHEEMLIMLA